MDSCETNPDRVRRGEDPREPEPYVAPTLVERGTIEEITQSVVGSGDDGVLGSAVA